MEKEAVTISNKRKPNHGKFKKKRKLNPKVAQKSKRPSKKMIKLFEKRAKAYNSDEEDNLDLNQEDSSEEGESRRLNDSKGNSGSENEEDPYVHQQGIMKFTEGCRAFRMTFMKIMGKNLTNDPLGPILSAHKKLVVEKLAEEKVEHKINDAVKKEKHMVAEMGHVKPVGFLDAKEKLLIGVATKGVVKLFNAVNKAQNPHTGLNSSKSKDAKALAKQRKDAFLSELKKSTTSSAFKSSKVSYFNKTNDEEPGWAPLRDGYLLTSSKLQDWDKREDSASISGFTNMPSNESSSDED